MESTFPLSMSKSPKSDTNSLWKWKGNGLHLRTTKKNNDGNQFPVPEFLRDMGSKTDGVVLGPGYGLGFGCGAGIGFGLVGGLGYGGWPWNHLKLVLGAGIGCGFGVGAGYGQGIGYGCTLDTFRARLSERRSGKRRRIVLDY